jgi:hypothetical protein
MKANNRPLGLPHAARWISRVQAAPGPASLRYGRAAISPYVQARLGHEQSSDGRRGREELMPQNSRAPPLPPSAVRDP